MLNVLLLIGGLLLILIGANGLTEGASDIAKRFKISNLVIGLTIVAFGTSAPEFTVSIISAFNGNMDISIGNIIGSNLFNTLMIVGCTAIVTPIVITRGNLSKDIPLCILASIVLALLANDVWINHDLVNQISRTDGLLLLCFFAIFISYTFAIARNKEEKEEEEYIEKEIVKSRALGISVLWVLGGLTALILGGKIFVEGAVSIARYLGASEAIIGITLVAGGTSIPELATSIVAALKKKPDMAIGGIVGSNLFNIFFVLGCSASIFPITLGEINNMSFFMLISSCILLYIVGMFFRERTITRSEGIVLVLSYISYIVYLTL